ncbi:response regulator [Dolichospermum sp. UHCC 0259]|uniref:hybrid sensor histidine kinase/response regulator n=1 Tax=Dolichospermum sp. UHCC 0259 TaxID=2590010 RepID=UPI0020C3AF22|nr:response regulator [Dolichospermum sp. UHCC 0259]
MNTTMISASEQIILVVDDLPDNLRVLSAVLTEQGFQVRCAKSGKIALMATQNSSIDLILLDINMPDMDGYEVCKRLKSNEFTRHIPVIFLSALDDVFDKVKAFNAGCVDYITKPFQIEEVLIRIQRQLELQAAKAKIEQINQQLEERVEERTAQLAKINQELELEITERKLAEFRLQQINETLEERVEVRTLELQNALQQIQLTQAQAIQSEKMSSLGQLVAGVAHEINNPVGFIYGNISYLKQSMDDLLSLVALYQEIHGNNHPKIESLSEGINLEFLVADIPKIINSIEVGSRRIRDIVLSLRNFSRMDEAEFKQVNVHDGIESTLLILQHRLKANSEQPEIEIIREYGDLPQVQCYAGQLNQVFMNILVNAIDAIEEKKTSLNLTESNSNLDQIIIRTKIIDEKWIQIAIADNGNGISVNVKNRIFDPFFTTKEIGKGTGMGMAISYQIITEKHHGKLECFSDIGKGTEFIIQIPIEQAANNTTY